MSSKILENDDEMEEAGEEEGEEGEEEEEEEEVEEVRGALLRIQQRELKRKQAEERKAQKKQKVEETAPSVKAKAKATSNCRIGFGADVSTDPMGKLVCEDEYGIWRTVPGFDEDKVIVSSDGWVKVASHGISLENAVPTKGYLVPETQRHSISVCGIVYFSHQLVCRAFHGPRPTDKHTVDHINQERTDNRASNLKWETKVGQTLNRRKDRKTHSNSVPILGKKIGFEEEWVAYESAWKAALQLSLQQANISGVIRGKRTQTGGYIFKQNIDAMESERLDGEVWAGVFGHEFKYQVSNFGRFRFKGKAKVWGPPYTPRPTDGFAYAVVKIHGKLVGLHRVVFEAFHKRTIKPGHVIDHKNSQKSNNQLSNLQETTYSQNIQKEHDRGNISSNASKTSIPILVWNAKTETSANARTYNSMSEACRAEKTSQGAVSKAFTLKKCNPVLYKGRYWQKVFSKDAK